MKHEEKPVGVVEFLMTMADDPEVPDKYRVKASALAVDPSANPFAPPIRFGLENNGPRAGQLRRNIRRFARRALLSKMMNLAKVSGWGDDNPREGVPNFREEKRTLVVEFRFERRFTQW
jgi:hypothetical protein